MSCERLGGIKKRANTRKSNKFRVTLATTTKNGHTKQKGSERFEKNERLSKKKPFFGLFVLSVKAYFKRIHIKHTHELMHISGFGTQIQ